MLMSCYSFQPVCPLTKLIVLFLDSVEQTAKVLFLTGPTISIAKWQPVKNFIPVGRKGRVSL